VYVRVRVFGRSAGGIAGVINAHRPVAGDRAMCIAGTGVEESRDVGTSKRKEGRP